MWSEVWIRVQHERCLLKEADITAGSYGNKVHDADLPLQNYQQKMQLWQHLFLTEAPSALRKQQDSVRTQQGSYVVVLGAVCTCRFSLSWAASVGWLNRSMVPLPNFVMAPRGNRRGKTWKKWQTTDSFTSLNFTIWYKCSTKHCIMQHSASQTGRDSM